MLLFLSLFFTIASCTYNIISVSESSTKTTGTIHLVSDPTNEDIIDLTFEAVFETVNRIHVRITDAYIPRWHISTDTLHPDSDSHVITPIHRDDASYIFNYNKNPFSFDITRKKDSKILFNLVDSFIFQNLYLQLSTNIETDSCIMGLLEHAGGPLCLERKQTRLLWNRDEYYQSSYSSHPFYIELSQDGTSYGVLLLSSNGMEITVGQSEIDYKIIGEGGLDIYVFTGSSLSNVIQDYWDFIGSPFLPPIWALGYHQARYGYKNIDELNEVVDKLMDNNIAFDTIWSDIDYLNSYRDFSTSPDRYPEEELGILDNFLHGNNKHHVYILDPGIPQCVYFHYTDLILNDCFIKHENDDKPVLQRGWPYEPIAFPDYTHPSATNWLLKSIQTFQEIGPDPDGFWLDMNEPACYCDIEWLPENNCKNVEEFAPTYIYNEPIVNISKISQYEYITNSQQTQSPVFPSGRKLSDMNIHPYSRHYSTKHMNLHNLYGHDQLRTHVKALEKSWELLDPQDIRRAFVLSRATFPGSGTYGGTWTGDIPSTFDSMVDSIPQLLTHNMLGIPFVGADVCGFGGDTSIELCARWFELGCFSPFFRNHNSWDTVSQEPYNLGDEFLVIAKKVLNIRYKFLPYIYTMFYLSHTEGIPVMRPLSYDFPNDKKVLTSYTEFMFGSSILVAPVLENLARDLTVYLPEGDWYNFENGLSMKSIDEISHSISISNYPAPLDTIPFFVRGGHIIVNRHPRMSSGQMEEENTPYEIIVVIDRTNHYDFSDLLFIDDGITCDTIKNEKYSLIKFTANTKYSSGGKYRIVVSSDILMNGYHPIKDPYINCLTILGLSRDHNITEVKINEKTVNYDHYRFEKELFIIQYEFSLTTKFKLEISTLKNSHVLLSNTTVIIIVVSLSGMVLMCCLWAGWGFILECCCPKTKNPGYINDAKNEGLYMKLEEIELKIQKQKQTKIKRKNHLEDDEPIMI